MLWCGCLWCVNICICMFYVRRVLGALISAHLLIMDKEQPFGNLRPSWYDGELLQLAHDLASRLLPAFEESSTGIPYPRVICLIYLNIFVFDLAFTADVRNFMSQIWRCVLPVSLMKRSECNLDTFLLMSINWYRKSLVSVAITITTTVTKE